MHHIDDPDKNKNGVKCKMKIGFTINIGNYDSFKIESNDQPDYSHCMIEIYNVLYNLAPGDSYIAEFMKRDYFKLARRVVEGKE